ncbi:unnamed protein product [Paramecium sonneborni]|uniref:Transmembrane protein n=1 Tax=Paramecium sonneborni TaxID=65129 RepID=A0A8S1R3T8_9CILI|nr:unnamed protein product [Paramecium sonneborni]
MEKQQLLRQQRKLLSNLIQVPKTAQNAVVINLFCIEERFESRSLDFVQRVFKLFPDREYLVLTQPYTVQETTLLQHFFKVPRNNNSTFEHVLYIYHRNSLDSHLIGLRKLNQNEWAQCYLLQRRNYWFVLHEKIWKFAIFKITRLQDHIQQKNIQNIYIYGYQQGFESSFYESFQGKFVGQWIRHVQCWKYMTEYYFLIFFMSLILLEVEHFLILKNKNGIGLGLQIKINENEWEQFQMIVILMIKTRLYFHQQCQQKNSCQVQKYRTIQGLQLLEHQIQDYLLLNLYQLQKISILPIQFYQLLEDYQQCRQNMNSKGQKQ